MRTEELARSVSEEVSKVPGVVRLTGGSAIEAATQYAGGKVMGVRLGDQVEVHLVATLTPLPPVADRAAAAARKALRAAGDRRRVRIFIEDIEVD